MELVGSIIRPLESKPLEYAQAVFKTIYNKWMRSLSQRTKALPCIDKILSA